MNIPQPLQHVVSDALANELWQQSPTVDSFLRALRSQGAYKVESISTLRRVAKMPLGEAKDAVHRSRAWADTRAQDEQLQERLCEAVRDEEHASDEVRYSEKIAS